jgi:hypothetical protein
MVLKKTSKKKEKISKAVVFDPQKCKSILERGKYYKPSNKEIVIDTGDFDIGNNGNPFKKTIAVGVIDHHRIDNLLKGKNRESKLKCSAMMVADFKDTILKMIKERKVIKTISHSDGDLDSVVSSYLVQSLIQTGELPASAYNLSKHVNKVDYGMYRETRVNKYLSSLAGVFSAIKKCIERKNRKDQKENDDKLNEIIFKILNEINGDFDYERDMNKIVKKMPNSIKKLIDGGKEIIRKEFEHFDSEFKKSIKSTVFVKRIKDGKDIEVPIIISLEPRMTSIDFINFSYSKTLPETIIAVYAGSKRGDSYMYNIGLRLESASSIDMSDICFRLNRIEKQKREQLSKNDEILKDLESQPDRLNMSGSMQILKKDPCVIVGGGSLISSPRNSLLSKKDFYQTIQM